MRDFIITKDNSTSTTAAIAHSVTITQVTQLISVTVAFNTAPSTSEDLTVTLDANAGATYDVTLYSVDPSTTGATSIVYQPDQELWLDNGDQIDVAFVNTDNRTYGSEITVKELL